MDATLTKVSTPVSIRPLKGAELDKADQIFRSSFGTFLGLPDPSAFMSGAELVRARWRSNPSAFLAAELDGEIVGSCYATNWGSLGFFGPLTIQPGLWDRGLGQKLLEQVIELFGTWQTRHIGLFTFPHSAKHIALYQKFGFWPRHLTAVMRKRAEKVVGAAYTLLSEVPEPARAEYLKACSGLCDSVCAGLDLGPEISTVLAHKFGDVVLLVNGSQLVAFGICHCGPGSEAETGSCYVKFGLCRPEPQAQASFARLLDACQSFAARRATAWLVAGVNTARHQAYRSMLEAGFKPEIYGIAMHRPNEPAYNREGIFLLDDWR
jgi:N-acetylglutamate synthase-like GNAT family acetyltransferase